MKVPEEGASWLTYLQRQLPSVCVLGESRRGVIRNVICVSLPKAKHLKLCFNSTYFD